MSLISNLMVTFYSLMTSTASIECEPQNTPEIQLEANGVVMEPDMFLDVLDEAFPLRSRRLHLLGHEVAVRPLRRYHPQIRLQTWLVFERCAEENLPAEVCIAIPLVESKWTSWARNDASDTIKYCGMFQRSARYSYSREERIRLTAGGDFTAQQMDNRCQEIIDSAELQVSMFIQYLNWMRQFEGSPINNACRYKTGYEACASNHPYSVRARQLLETVTSAYARAERRVSLDAQPAYCSARAH
jgi:hypothetical protein